MFPRVTLDRQVVTSANPIVVIEDDPGFALVLCEGCLRVGWKFLARG